MGVNWTPVKTKAAKRLQLKKTVFNPKTPPKRVIIKFDARGGTMGGSTGGSVTRLQKGYNLKKPFLTLKPPKNEL